MPIVLARSKLYGTRYERVCKTLRNDGAYVAMREEVPCDILQSLPSYPNAIGVLGYDLFRLVGPDFKNNYMLLTNRHPLQAGELRNTEPRDPSRVAGVNDP